MSKGLEPPPDRSGLHLARFQAGDDGGICNITSIVEELSCLGLCREAVLFPAAQPPRVLAERWEGSSPASPTESLSGLEPGGDFHAARVVFSSFPVGL